MSARGKLWGRRFAEKASTGKEAGLAAIDQTYATDFVIHIDGEDIHGLENWKRWTSEFYDAFPDVHFTFDDRIVKGDKVVTRVTMTGTHTGEYMDIPPTNKKVTWSAIEIFRRAGGKIKESWAINDRLGLMRQLGLIPTPQTET